MTLSGYQQGADGTQSLSDLKRTAAVTWSMSYDSKDARGWVLSTLSGSMQESAEYPVMGEPPTPTSCAMRFGLAKSNAGPESDIYKATPSRYQVTTPGIGVTDDMSVTVTQETASVPPPDCDAPDWNAGNGGAFERALALGSPVPPEFAPAPQLPTDTASSKPYNITYTHTCADECLAWGADDFVSGTVTFQLTSTLSFSPSNCSVGAAIAHVDHSDASAHAAASGHSCGNYVAMGDSFASGTSGPDPCLRSDDSYPEDYAHNYGAPVKFVACSGETTQAIEKHQLTALSKRTRIVSVSAGGDDANLFGVVINCVLLGVQPGNCWKTLDTSLKSKTASLAHVQANLVGLYRQIHNRAQHARIYVLGYPSPVPPHIPKSCIASLRLWSAGGLLGLRREDAGLFWEVLQRLNKAVKAAAKATGVHYVAPFTGHDICSSDPYFWPLTGGTETLHPNADGYRAMAYALGHAAGPPPH